MDGTNNTRRRLAAMERMVHHLVREAEDLHRDGADAEPLLHVIQHLSRAGTLLTQANSDTPERTLIPAIQGFRHDH